MTSGPARQSAVQGQASVFRANVPQVFLDVDRTACMIKGVELQDVFTTLQVYLGSLYVNDFNLFGRTWQVIVQAEANFRDQKDDINRLQVRNTRGTMVPLGAVAKVREINGPLVLTRYNMYPAASINGNAAPGVSSGRAIEVMEELAKRELPQSMSYEWTELAYLELQAGNTAMIVFGFSIVMVFLVLAAQFESWSHAAGGDPVGAAVPAQRAHGRDNAKSWAPTIPAWTSTSSPRSAWWCWWAWPARTRS